MATSSNFLLPLAALVCLAGTVLANGPSGASRVIIYDGVATEVGPSQIQSSDLWITSEDLARATKFEVKPQGVCRDELCFPIPKNRKDSLLQKQASVTWFNLSEFARMVNQPTAYDEKHSTWYFGARQAAQNSFVDTLEAPNFTLPDINGKMHSLADFRGKKVLLLTWASW
jgi:hypothetical protein